MTGRYTNGSKESSDRAAVRAAWAVSLQSVAWTLIAGTGAIAIGVASGSAVLTAFGAIGLVDAVGSAALVHHFRHGLRHAELTDRLERLAHRVVIVGLVTVGAGALVAGGVRLAGERAIESSAYGTWLAAASLIVLITLSRRKRRLAVDVASPALRSDGHLSAVGAAQASVTLAGAVTTMIGWRWADPAAAMAVGAVAVAVGVQTWRAELRPAGGPTRRSWLSLAIAFLLVIAAVDAALGHRAILTGLLMFAPGLAAASRRPWGTAIVGAGAVGLSVALGVPNEIWLTGAHALWVTFVAIAAIVTIPVAMVLSRIDVSPHHHPAS